MRAILDHAKSHQAQKDAGNWQKNMNEICGGLAKEYPPFVNGYCFRYPEFHDTASEAKDFMDKNCPGGCPSTSVPLPERKPLPPLLFPDAWPFSWPWPFEGWELPPVPVEVIP